MIDSMKSMFKLLDSKITVETLQLCSFLSPFLVTVESKIICTYK